MKVLIVSAWRDRYHGDERAREFPALSAVHLAALCPPHVEVEVAHDQIRPVAAAAVTADLVAITSTTANVVRAYELADALRARGIAVIMGGPHPSLLPQEALRHADAVAVGYAELSFPRMLEDFARGRMNGVYTQPGNLPLDTLPVPRYDLFEDEFRFRCFVQATRGCPFHCTFCTIKSIDRVFRLRPVDQVVRDIAACEGRTWLQRKAVWFVDDNLTGHRAYAERLFQALAPLRRWWWTQCSIDVAEDAALLRLAARSGCRAVFVGVETFSAENLAQVRKKQNHIDRYRRAVRAFHNAGIAVHAGIIIGLDDDSDASARRIPDLVAELEIDLPFVNLLTPFPATPLRRQLDDDGRLLEAGWERHNGAGVTFVPQRMTPAALEQVYWDVHRELYTPGRVLRRAFTSLRRAAAPGALLSVYVNGMYAAQNMISPDRPWQCDTLAAHSAAAFAESVT